MDRRRGAWTSWTSARYGPGNGRAFHHRQGNLDAILASRPEDRRALIEEAAGVLKHKQRKERSERKLAAMGTHLARVKDVAAEVERQLKPLARKAARAQAYESVSKELAELELMLAVDICASCRLAGTTRCCASARRPPRSTWRAFADEAAAKLRNSRRLLQEKGLYVGDLTAQRGRFHMALERLESNDVLLREKARGIRERLASAPRRSRGQCAAHRALRARSVRASRGKAGDVAARRDALASAIDELARDHVQAGAERARADELLSKPGRIRICERELDAALARAELQDGLAGRLSSKELLESKKAELSAELESARVEAQRLERDAACAAARSTELKGRSEAAATAVGEASGRCLCCARCVRTRAVPCRRPRGASRRSSSCAEALRAATRLRPGWRPREGISMRRHSPYRRALKFRRSSRRSSSSSSPTTLPLCVRRARARLRDRRGDLRRPRRRRRQRADRIRRLRAACRGRTPARPDRVYPRRSAAMESLLGVVVLVSSFDEAAAHAAQGDSRLRFAAFDEFVVSGREGVVRLGRRRPHGLACPRARARRAAVRSGRGEGRLGRCRKRPRRSRPRT